MIICATCLPSGRSVAKTPSNLSVDPSLKQGVTLILTFGQFEFDFLGGSVIFIADEITGFHISNHRRLLYISAWICDASAG